MAGNLDTTEGLAPADGSEADDLRDRRRARAVVNEALRSAGTPLDHRGLRHRLLPGLWQAAMSVVLTCLERDDVLALLTDRARGIVGEGSNHDAPARALEGRAMAAYVSDVASAGETVMERLEEALERLKEMGAEDAFPETVLDVSLQVLIPAWGPHHVRRALAEQSALVLKGVEEPANVMEPMRLNTPAPRPGAPLPQSPAPSATPREDDSPRSKHAPEPPRRERVPRRVTAFATHDVSPTGVAAWAVAMVCLDDAGRTERREIGGVMRDPTGRNASIKAVSECVAAACEGSSRASILVETPSEQCVRAASGGGSPGARLAGEEALWEGVDAAAALHEISFRLSRSAMDRDLSERCDRMVRVLLES